MRFTDQLAIRDGETSLTYAELACAAREFGAALVASGIEPGERVGLWAFNSVEWVIAALGILSAGGVLVPVNTRFKGPEAVEILRRSGARAVVTVTGFLGRDYVAMLEDRSADLPALTTVIAARGAATGRSVAWRDFLARSCPDTHAALRRRSAALGPGDRSDILFTSGTTGMPKGAVMTHGRTLHVATDWVAMTGLTSGDIYLMVNPFFHMFGLKAGILACVAAGATMLPEAVFDVDHVLSRVQGSA